MATARRVWSGSRSLSRMTVPIDSLAAHPENARRHDMDTIVGSLEAFGQQRPILVVPAGRVDPERPTIIAGHGTTAGAEQLGWTHIAALESDLTDAEIERFVLADNRASDLATYDDELLARLLQQAAESERGLAGTGYAKDDLDELLAEVEWKRKRAANRDAEDVPEPPEKPKSVSTSSGRTAWPAATPRTPSSSDGCSTVGSRASSWPIRPTTSATTAARRT